MFFFDANMWFQPILQVETFAKKVRSQRQLCFFYPTSYFFPENSTCPLRSGTIWKGNVIWSNHGFSGGRTVSFRESTSFEAVFFLTHFLHRKVWWKDSIFLPGTWNIHFQMVVSIGWFQIFTWKMVVSTKHLFKTGCLEFQISKKIPRECWNMPQLPQNTNMKRLSFINSCFFLGGGMFQGYCWSFVKRPGIGGSKLAKKPTFFWRNLAESAGARKGLQ